MKKRIMGLFFCMATIFTLGTFSIHAQYKNFSGSAGFTQKKVGTQNTKENYEYLSGVNWKKSDHKDHKMWFTIKNSDGVQRGRQLINRPGNGTTYFETNCKYGYYYYLYANREHLGNPNTYVSGTWQP